MKIEIEYEEGFEPYILGLAEKLAMRNDYTQVEYLAWAAQFVKTIAEKARQK